MKKWLVLLTKILLTFSVLYFVYRQAAHNWDAIAGYEWRLDPGWLLLSLVLALSALVIFSFCWRLIIKSLGREISGSAAFKVSYLSSLGRYIPGKVWQLFGIIYLAKKQGIEPEEAGASFILVQLFAIPASLLVFVLAARLEPDLLVGRVAILGSGSALLLIILACLLCGSIIFLPNPVKRFGNWILSRFGRPPVQFELSSKIAAKLFAGYLIGWTLYGLAFWCFSNAMLEQGGLGPIAAVGLYNAAYQIGYLALFAPGGLGPRELAMAALLAPFAGPLASAVAILARLWSIAIELIAAALALTVRE